ncbi:methyl-accepting chemotaxis protein [Desulfococcaceae bacterium HSG8]|nr:methyl-accepting chemotaxis protein [Desulfococcaceae bacterium HSG8]
MKIKKKIMLFLLINLTLYIISFWLTQFYNGKTYQYQAFNSRIKSFESSLLGTIISERNYAKHPSSEAAKKVLSDIDENIRLLEGITTNASQARKDLENLSKLLADYKKKFMLLVDNNREIISLKIQWDELTKDFQNNSEQLAEEIDGIIGTAYLNGKEPDPMYGSCAISNKNIVNAVSEISLAINKDLLLEDKENIFLETYKKTVTIVNKERKNISALAKFTHKKLFTDFSTYAGERLNKIEELTAHIHKIWQENTKLEFQLNSVRKGMIAGERGISDWIQSSLDGIRDKNLISAIIGFFLILLVIGTGGIIILRSVNHPIKKLTAMVTDLAQGEGDLTVRLDFEHKDEMGEVANQFNIFIEKIRVMVREAARNAETLTESSYSSLKLSEQMTEDANQMSEISNNVSTATEEVSMNINTMASATEEMSVNIQSISSTAEQMSRNMNAVVSAIEEMATAINEIARNAQEGARVSAQSVKMANTATEAMNSLGDAAKEIGEVTKLITRIAEQTNLLALNATIEAASAGEAGKGFAVVANEIKELAKQSAMAAENIARRIDGVQKNTDGAIRVIDEILAIINKVNASTLVITNAVDLQTHTTNDITNNVRQANIGSGNIAKAIAEVAKGANDMSKNAGEAAKGANEMAANVQLISQSAEGASNRAGQVNVSAEELSDIAVQLREMVGRFKV